MSDPVKDSETTEESVSKHDAKASGSRVKKLIGAGILVVVMTAVGIFAVEYMRRGPIREAATKIKEKDFEYAMTVLDEFLIKYPDDVQALSLKAQAHAGKNEFLQCKELFERLHGPSTIDDMVALAKSLTVLEYYTEAYNNWIGVMAKIGEGELDGRSAEEKNTIQAESLYFMSACQTELGQLDRALQTANELMQIPGHQVVGSYLLGLVEIKRGKNNSAIEHWNQVHQQDPNGQLIKVPAAVFQYEIGILKVENGVYEEGIEHLKKSLELNNFSDVPIASNSLVAIGEAYDSLGNDEQARFFWNRQLEFQNQFGLPPNRPAREGLANLALLKKKPNEAISYLVPLRDQGNLKSSTTYLMQRALSMIGKEKEAGDFEELTKELRATETKVRNIRESLRDRQGTYWAVAVKAWDFAKAGNWRQAEALMATVTEEPADPFSVKLRSAIRQKGNLPKLTDIPLDVF